MKTPVLNACPFCTGPAEIRPSFQRGHSVALCADVDAACTVGPVTQPYPSEVEASDAWNRGEFAHATPAMLANAE